MSKDVAALLGGKPVNPNPLPSYNTIDHRELEAVKRVLESGVLSGFAAQPNQDHFGGPIVQKLEDSFCQRFGSNHAIALNSATSGLHATVSAMGIGPGDEVITPPYTMTASATAVLFTNAVPIFADIDNEIFCLDPKSVEERITPRTRGIMAVNLFGHPAPLQELRQIADKHGLFLIEDNAQAPLAKIGEMYTGTIGDASVFSLNRHKTMQCGEGGVVICNDNRIAERCRLMRNHGEVLVDAMHVEDIVNTIGLNYRITNMEAAVAQVQFEKLPALTEQRINLANRLRDGLRSVSGITPPVVKDGCTHVYYFFTMKYDAEVTGLNRKLFADSVTAEGYPLSAGYVKPLYLEPLYQKRICFGPDGAPFSFNQYVDENTYRKGICPVVERLQDSDLIWTNIIYPPLTNDHMDGFVEACTKVIKHRDQLIQKFGQSATE